jgi:hypothetical protein
MSERTQPWELEPLNPEKRKRYPAPTERGDMLHDGYVRLASADSRTGIRPVVGGRPVYHPVYHEDN